MSKKKLLALCSIPIVIGVIVVFLWMGALSYDFVHYAEPEYNPDYKEPEIPYEQRNFYISFGTPKYHHENDTTTVKCYIRNENWDITLYNVILTFTYHEFGYKASFDVGDFEPKQSKTFYFNIPHGTYSDCYRAEHTAKCVGDLEP